MKYLKSLIPTTVMLFTLLHIAYAQNYSIDWYKIAGGGGTSTGGGYSVSSTIGQHDAGMMTGGSFSLIGGFWSIFAVQTLGAPLLKITYSGNQAIVSWSSSVTGWTLQTNGDFGTTNWVNYGGTIINNTVTNSPTAGDLFFRLRHP